MYNWIYNRIRYIIGESYVIGGRNYLSKGLFWSGFKYPKTPLPIINKADEYGGAVVMSNVGAGLYFNGKRDNKLKGLLLDGEKVYAKSPRVGIVQIGRGLFSEITAINKNETSEANSIQRLGTLFHEARHSDGNGSHLGFFHKKCPAGHNFSGLFACEDYNNGAYKVGSLVRKAYLKACKTCSLEDRTLLEASILDASSRVVFRSHVKTKAEILKEIKMYEDVVKVYESLLETATAQTEDSLKKEYQRLLDKIKECKEQLAELNEIPTGKNVSSRPEGEYQNFNKGMTSRLMNSH